MSDDPHVEVASPLALLDTIARRHGCRLGVKLGHGKRSPRGGPATPPQRPRALEVRKGTGAWANRELIAVHVNDDGPLVLQGSAADLLEALGRQDWLDVGPESR